MSDDEQLLVRLNDAANATNDAALTDWCDAFTDAIAEITRLNMEIASARRDALREAAEVARNAEIINGVELITGGFPDMIREQLAAALEALAEAPDNE